MTENERQEYLKRMISTGKRIRNIEGAKELSFWECSQYNIPELEELEHTESALEKMFMYSANRAGIDTGIAEKYLNHYISGAN